MTIYCDHNATSPVRLDVAEAVGEALRTGGNPSSVHAAGRRARGLVERSRSQVARLVSAPAEAVVFTGSGTEANNLALTCCRPASVIVSATEHASVLDVVPDAVRVPVDADGVIDIAAFERIVAAAPSSSLVSVMLANNETGVLQPVSEIARIAHRHGALVHTDAVQAAGRVVVDMKQLGVDMVTLSGHKLGGPQGVGALIIDDHVTMEPLIRGGGQEKRRRAGTENVAGIVGFGVAAEGAVADLPEMARVAGLRDRFEAGLAKITPEAGPYGAAVERLGNTCCIGMSGVSSETQVMTFDLAGIAVSAGSACSSGKVEASHVLRAMGVDEAAAREAVRISFGRATTDADIDAVLAVWQSLYRRAGARVDVEGKMLAVEAAA